MQQALAANAATLAQLRRRIFLHLHKSHVVARSRALQHCAVEISRRATLQIGVRLRAVIALVLASAAVSLLPFRLLAKSAECGGAKAGRNNSDRAAAPRIALAVESASRLLPWRTMCIQKSVALQWMLRLGGYPSLLHFGICQEDDRLSAHIWVSLDGIILIGEETVGRHAQVATFPVADDCSSLDGQKASS
jgi:hypothetical protein